MRRRSAATSLERGRSIAPVCGFRNQPRQSEADLRPRGLVTVGFTGSGANEMRARLPEMTSPAIARSSVSAVEE